MKRWERLNTVLRALRESDSQSDILAIEGAVACEKDARPRTQGRVDGVEVLHAVPVVLAIKRGRGDLGLRHWCGGAIEITVVVATASLLPGVFRFFSPPSEAEAAQLCYLEVLALGFLVSALQVALKQQR